MAREKTVRLNEAELEALKNYREENYDGYIPLGFVIGELARES